MIKKITLTMLFVLIYSLGFSQKIIKNPKNGSSDYFGDLVKIELKDSLSIFYFDKKTNDSIAYKLNDKFFLQTEVDNSKFFLLGVKNIIDKPNKEDGYTYVVNFQPINVEAMTINIMYKQESSGSLEIRTRKLYNSIIRC